MKYVINHKGKPSTYEPFTDKDEAAKRLLWDNGYWGIGDDERSLLVPHKYLDEIQTRHKNPVLQDWTIEEV